MGLVHSVELDQVDRDPTGGVLLSGRPPWVETRRRGFPCVEMPGAGPLGGLACRWGPVLPGSIEVLPRPVWSPRVELGQVDQDSYRGRSPRVRFPGVGPRGAGLRAGRVPPGINRGAPPGAGRFPCIGLD